MDTIVFPPYGNLTEQHLIRLKQFVVVPADWRAPAKFPGSVEDHHECYMQTVIKIIDRDLWPAYGKSGWPSDRMPQMQELTRLDIEVQQEAAKHLDKFVFPGSKTTHRNLFQIEDGPEDFGAEFDKYDDSELFTTLQTIKSVSAKGQDRKVGWGVVRLKQLFQRPRLYQTSLLFGHREFEWQEAESSLTPSLPSGHTLQGMLWVGAALEQLLDSGITISDAFRQYLVDPGDRRVMAGVHYPSDNLASWLMIFLSIPHVFRNQNVKEEFWRALEKQSLVYGLMEEAGGAYRPALDALKAAYSGELTVEYLAGAASV
jgi:hypothetical protein